MSIERRQRRQAIRELRKTAGISRRDAKTVIDLGIAQQNAYDRYNQGNVTTQMMKPSEASEINQDWKENGEDGALYHPVGDTFQDPTELQASTVSAERPASQEQLDFNRNIREGRDSTVPYIAGTLAGSYGLANALWGLGSLGASSIGSAGSSAIKNSADAAKIARDITSKYSQAFSAPLKKRKILNAINRGIEKVAPSVGKASSVLEKFSPGYWVENAMNKAGMHVMGNVADKVDLMADAAGILPGYVSGIHNISNNPDIDTLGKAFADTGKQTIKDWGLWSLPIFSGAFGRKANIVNYLNSLNGKYVGEVPELKNQLIRGINGRQFRDGSWNKTDLSTAKLWRTPLENDNVMQNNGGDIEFDLLPAFKDLGTKQSVDGVLNHEFAHSFQNFFKDPIARWSSEAGYYMPKENSWLYSTFKPLLNTTKLKWDELTKTYVPSTWAKSPNEVHSELANIKYLTGVNHISELGNWRRKNVTKTLAKRFGVSFDDMDKMIVALENNGY